MDFTKKLRHGITLLVPFLFILSFASSPSGAQPSENDFDRFTPEVFVSSDGDSMLYRIRHQRISDSKEPLPLLIFLHGAGERGSDNYRQLIHLDSLFLKDGPLHDKEAIILAPQSPVERYWVDIGLRDTLHAKEIEKVYKMLDQPATTEMKLVMAIQDSLLATGKVDPSRIYVMGLSMGGFGTFDLLSRRPGEFAAAIPICGGGHPEHAELQGRKTAIWITHGADDHIVLPEFSRRSYKELKKTGADVRYTEFPDTKHNAWSPTFAIPGIFDWLFEQTLDMKANKPD